MIRQSMRCGVVVGAAAALLVGGCQREKGTDTGKTYTSDSKGQQGGAGGGAGGESGAKPLNAPADTTNGRSSKASDVGSSDATRGQAVAEPGAPVEHDPQPQSSKAPASSGHL